MARSFRQGDVAFFEIDEVPEGFREIGRVLKIEGEREGHTHLMEGVQVLEPVAEVTTDVQERRVLLPMIVAPKIVVVPKETTITHPEHPVLKVPTGIWMVYQAREFTPEGEQPVD